MDYSLLLITEKNPDFKEKSEFDAASHRNYSVKSVGSALRPEGNTMLMRQPSGIPEVQEDLEDEDDDDDEDDEPKKMHSTLGDILDRSNDVNKNNHLLLSHEEEVKKSRVMTTAIPKLLDLGIRNSAHSKSNSTSFATKNQASKSIFSFLLIMILVQRSW